MTIEEQIKEPLKIVLNGEKSMILKDEIIEENIDLKKGSFFAGEHYGFVLVTTQNGMPKHKAYKTQFRIDAASFENGTLKIFEDNKDKPWLFNDKGVLIHCPKDEFNETFKRSLLENAPIYEEPVIKNPIWAKVTKDLHKSRVFCDENKDGYELYPGCFFGGLHYGFVIEFESEDGTIRITQPTQNRVESISVKDLADSIVIYEEGKYNPWKLLPNGEVLQEASYNTMSRKDVEHMGRPRS